MAHVTFAQDIERPPIDQALVESAAAAAKTGRPVRLRIQPDLYNHDKQAYSSWPGLSWTVELDAIDEGRRLREGLTWFFKHFGEQPEELLKVLRGL